MDNLSFYDYKHITYKTSIQNQYTCTDAAGSIFIVTSNENDDILRLCKIREHEDDQIVDLAKASPIKSDLIYLKKQKKLFIALEDQLVLIDTNLEETENISLEEPISAAKWNTNQDVLCVYFGTDKVGCFSITSDFKELIMLNEANINDEVFPDGLKTLLKNKKNKNGDAIKDNVEAMDGVVQNSTPVKVVQTKVAENIKEKADGDKTLENEVDNKTEVVEVKGDETPKVVDEKPKVVEEKPKVVDENDKVADEKPEVVDEKSKVVDDKVEAVDDKVEAVDDKVEALDDKVEAEDNKTKVDCNGKVDDCEPKTELVVKDEVSVDVNMPNDRITIDWDRCSDAFVVNCSIKTGRRILLFNTNCQILSKMDYSNFSPLIAIKPDSLRIACVMRKGSDQILTLIGNKLLAYDTKKLAKGVEVEYLTWSPCGDYLAVYQKLDENYFIDLYYHKNCEIKQRIPIKVNNPLIGFNFLETTPKMIVLQLLTQNGCYTYSYMKTVWRYEWLRVYGIFCNINGNHLTTQFHTQDPPQTGEFKAVVNVTTVQDVINAVIFNQTLNLIAVIQASNLVNIYDYSNLQNWKKVRSFQLEDLGLDCPISHYRFYFKLEDFISIAIQSDESDTTITYKDGTNTKVNCEKNIIYAQYLIKSMKDFLMSSKKYTIPIMKVTIVDVVKIHTTYLDIEGGLYINHVKINGEYTSMLCHYKFLLLTTKHKKKDSLVSCKLNHSNFLKIVSSKDIIKYSICRPVIKDALIWYSIGESNLAVLITPEGKTENFELANFNYVTHDKNTVKWANQTSPAVSIAHKLNTVFRPLIKKDVQPDPKKEAKKKKLAEKRKRQKEAKRLKQVAKQGNKSEPQQVKNASQQVNTNQQAKNTNQQVKNAPQQNRNGSQQVRHVNQQLSYMSQQLSDVPQQMRHAHQQIRNARFAPPHMRNTVQQQLNNVPQQIMNASRQVMNAFQQVMNTSQQIMNTPQHTNNALYQQQINAYPQQPQSETVKKPKWSKQKKREMQELHDQKLMPRKRFQNNPFKSNQPNPPPQFQQQNPAPSASYQNPQKRFRTEEPFVEHQKRFRPNHIPSEDLHVAILDNDRQNGSMGEDYASDLRSTILSSIDETIYANQRPPKFDSANLVRNYFEVKCVDQESLDWLKHTIGQLCSSQQGYNLRIVPKRFIPRIRKMSVFIPGPLEATRVVLDRLSGQNRLLNTARWNNYKNDVYDDGVLYFMEMDNDSYNELQRLDCIIFVGLDRLVFNDVREPQGYMQKEAPRWIPPPSVSNHGFMSR